MSETLHYHSPMPLVLFGGQGLGFNKAGQHLNFEGRAYNDFWITILEGFGITPADLQSVRVNGTSGAPTLQAPHRGVLQGVRG